MNPCTVKAGASELGAGMSACITCPAAPENPPLASGVFCCLLSRNGPDRRQVRKSPLLLLTSTPIKLGG